MGGEWGRYRERGVVTGGGSAVAGVVGKVQGEGEWHQEGIKGAQGTYKGSGRGRRMGSGTRRQGIEGVAEGGDDGGGRWERRGGGGGGGRGRIGRRGGERNRFVKHQPRKHQYKRDVHYLVLSFPWDIHTEEDDLSEEEDGEGKEGEEGREVVREEREREKGEGGRGGRKAGTEGGGER